MFGLWVFFGVLCRFHSSSLGSSSPRQSCVGLFGNMLGCRPKRLAREKAHDCTHLDPGISSTLCTQMQLDALPLAGFGGCHSWLFALTKFTIANSCFRQSRGLLGVQFRVESDRRGASSVGTHPPWAHMSNSMPLSPGSMLHLGP